MAATSKGRSTPPLPTFTFASGIEVEVRRVGLMTQQAILTAINEEWTAKGDGEPQPPLQRVNYGDEEQPDYKDEPNAADPAYKARLEAWNARFTLEFNDRLLRVAALEAEFEIDAAALKRKRRALKMVGARLAADDATLETDEQDKLDYFFHVIAEDQADLQGFYGVLLRRSQPTEEAVQRHAAAFQGDLEGAQPVGRNGAAVGD